MAAKVKAVPRLSVHDSSGGPKTHGESQYPDTGSTSGEIVTELVRRHENSYRHQKGQDVLQCFHGLVVPSDGARERAPVSHHNSSPERE